MTTATEIMSKLRGLDMGAKLLGGNDNRCAECGYSVGDQPGRYHPYEFCLVVKAGIDPEAFIAEHKDKVGKNVRDIPHD